MIYHNNINTVIPYPENQLKLLPNSSVDGILTLSSPLSEICDQCNM